MRWIRWIASLVLVVVAVRIIGDRVLGAYEMNLKKREIADRTNEAYRSQVSMRTFAGQLARSNAEALAPYAVRFPMDADLHVIRAANLRLIGRDYEAMQAYATAVRYQPSPELHVSLAQAQLALGRKDEARENAMRAVAFNPGLKPDADRIITAAAQ